jgi:hypothetical protein
MTNRWWIYQRERFPLITYAGLALVLSYSVTGFSALARGATTPPAAATFIPATLGVFLFFVLMRIADEFKDHADDARYRPYRAVPRGLVKLWELGCVAVCAALAQLLLASLLGAGMVLVLLTAWGYLSLMTAEFFVPRWLKAHPLTYLVSHMPMVGFITLYASAHDWLPVAATPSTGLAWLLMTSVLLGTVLEIARKIRAPLDEEHGVDTYTAVWGRGRAVAAWFVACVLAMASACAAASFIEFGAGLAAGLGVLVIVALLTARSFLRQPVRRGARRLEAVSGIFTLAAYAGLGPLAFLLT